MSKVKLLDITPVRDVIKQKMLERYDATSFFNVDKSISIQVDVADLLREYIESKQLDTPTVMITSDAYIKMRKLVEETSTEVGWYGTVEEHGNQFLITDILVYPQTVTGATCEQDDDRMFEFEMSLTDEQVNTKRFQGHSHVNMGVTPSGVDENFYNELLTQVNDYFIIMVTNKKDDVYLRFYDKLNNLVYEDLDLVIVSNEGVNYDEWYLEEAKKLAKKTFTPITTPAKNNIEDDPWDDDWWNRTIERQERMQGYAHIYGPSGDIVSSHRIKKKGDKRGKRL